MRAFVDEADRQVLDALEREDLDRPGHPLLDRAEAVFTILEHELMHQETLLYLIHQLPHDLKRAPADAREPDFGPAPEPHMVEVPRGVARLGARSGEFPFTWDNERPACEQPVEAFAIDAYNVTNGEFLAFVEDGKLRIGGALPTNPDGGGLSACHPGQRGMFLLVEATRQLRGEGGDRQVPGAEVAVAHGCGGVLSATSTVVLGSSR